MKRSLSQIRKVCWPDTLPLRNHLVFELRNIPKKLHYLLMTHRSASKGNYSNTAIKRVNVKCSKFVTDIFIKKAVMLIEYIEPKWNCITNQQLLH